MKELWIVGKSKSRGKWDFQGVFDSKENAIKACRNWKYFYAPAVLNEDIPDESTEWEGCNYPNQNITWKEYWEYYPLKALKVKILRFFKVDI